MPSKAPKTSSHLEVERKFDVDESTVTPSFEGIAAVARVEIAQVESLDATYFDTPKQDLAHNKITLRRRTGGHPTHFGIRLEFAVPDGPTGSYAFRIGAKASGAAGRTGFAHRDPCAA